MENGSAQAVLPLVGLAADKIIRDRYRPPWGNHDRSREGACPVTFRPFMPEMLDHVRAVCDRDGVDGRAERLWGWQGSDCRRLQAIHRTEDPW
ncbi:MAG: hypothetical protein R6U98_00760 [Pirellulaceae bacterium]